MQSTAIIQSILSSIAKQLYMYAHINAHLGNILLDDLYLLDFLLEVTSVQ